MHILFEDMAKLKIPSEIKPPLLLSKDNIMAFFLNQSVNDVINEDLLYKYPTTDKKT